MKSKKSKHTNKVSKVMSGNETVFRDALKRMYRPDVVGAYKAVLAVRGVDLKFSSNTFEEMVKAIFKVKNQTSITFQITTRTIYVF